MKLSLGKACCAEQCRNLGERRDCDPPGGDSLCLLPLPLPLPLVPSCALCFLFHSSFDALWLPPPRLPPSASFKWIGNKCLELRDSGVEVLFSYEEAIGFCIGDLVPDKDGVTAAAVFAEMAASLQENGKTCADYLLQLSNTYGHFVENNSYVFCYDPDITQRIFDRIVNEGK